MRYRLGSALLGLALAVSMTATALAQTEDDTRAQDHQYQLWRDRAGALSTRSRMGPSVVRRADSPQSRGTYVNFVNEDTREGVREVYGDSKYQRLGQLKQIYDPHNVLRGEPEHQTCIVSGIMPSSARIRPAS